MLNEEKLNNHIPLTNFPFTKWWRRMGNVRMGQYTIDLFCCSFLFRFSPAAVWGPPWARVLQDMLPLSWGLPQAAGLSMFQHLELILLILVSAGVFLTFFSSHSLLTACALSEACFLWDATPWPWGLSHALQWVGWSCPQDCPSQTLPCSPPGSKPCLIHLGHQDMVPENGRWCVSQHNGGSWNKDRE